MVTSMCGVWVVCGVQAGRVSPQGLGGEGPNECCGRRRRGAGRARRGGSESSEEVPLAVTVEVGRRREVVVRVTVLFFCQRGCHTVCTVTGVSPTQSRARRGRRVRGAHGSASGRRTNVMRPRATPLRANGARTPVVTACHCSGTASGSASLPAKSRCHGVMHRHGLRLRLAELDSEEGHTVVQPRTPTAWPEPPRRR